MKKTKYAFKVRKNDYQDLKQAVNNFNKKISELEKTERASYLPEKIDLSELRARIEKGSQFATKNELRRYITDLRRFNEKGQENLFVAGSGEKFTIWEAQSLQKQADIRIKQLEKELKPYKQKDSSGYSKVQMGNTEARAIQFNIDRLKNLFNTKNQNGKLDRLKTYVRTTGTLDYTLKKARIYKENYLGVLKRNYSGFDGYKEMMLVLEKLSPEDFFERMKNADDINIIDLQYQSDKVMSQQGFYNFINKVGVTLDKTEEIVEVQDNNFSNSMKYALVSRTGIIIQRAENKQTLVNTILNSNDSDITQGRIIEI